ncbi:entry exclusion protein TrbK [Agrobacterium burrii]
MSPGPMIILIVVGIIAFGVGVARWVVEPTSAPASGTGQVSQDAASDAERRTHRENFFGGSDRDIRGGQEMKPRW